MIDTFETYQEVKKASETKEQAIEEQKTGTGSLLDPLCYISSFPRLSNPYLLLAESLVSDL
jgi:hypothetical protein